MKFSNRALYALRAVFDLAYHGGEAPVQLRDIADRQTIPVKFLEQILGDLKRSGLVVSKRGPKGGYRLVGETNETTIADVLNAINEHPEPPEKRDLFVDMICNELISGFSNQLSRVTLDDLVVRGSEDGIPRACYEEFVYVI